MVELQKMFTLNGWDTNVIAYSAIPITLIILLVVFQYLRNDEPDQD